MTITRSDRGLLWRSRSIGIFLFFVSATVVAQPGPDDVFKYLRLDYPGLEEVQKAVEEGNLSEGRAALLRYFQTRKDRLGSGLYAFGQGDSAQAFMNARNHFSWKGTSKDFGKTIDWSFIGLDREWNYSLNRMLWFENFVEVYRRSRDETLVRAWKDQVMSWIRIGDPGYPRSIDTGRRMESLASSYCMFVTELRSPSVDPETNAILLASIHQQCEFLYHPDNWRRYSNWGTFESSGLARAAVLFPEFKRNNLWLRELFFRMQVQLGLSYYPDGMHVEVSPSYHAGELQVWFDFNTLVERNGVDNPWSPQSEQPSPASLFRAPAEALAYLITPSGRFPPTGDTDDSEGLELLDGMSTYLDDPHLRFVATRGREGVPPVESTRAFPDVGYFVLRSGWGDAQRPFNQQLYLLFDATVNLPWHAHRDAFNILLSAYDHELLVDAGRFTYNAGPDRELFLSAASHNTVVIDGTDQTKFDKKPKAWWKFTSTFDCVSAARMQGEVEHRRTVCYVKPDYAVVIDQVAGQGAHAYRQYWHLDPSATGQVTLSGQRVVSPNLLLSSSSPAGSLQLTKGPVSKRYRERTEGPVITCSWEATGKSSVATLLYPFRREAPRVDFSDVTSGDLRAHHTIVRMDHGGFRDFLYVAADSSRREDAGIVTDADILFLRRTQGGELNSFTALRCAYLKIDGKLYHETSGMKRDVFFDGERIEIK